MSGVEPVSRASAGLSATAYQDLAGATSEVRAELVADGVPGKLADKDPTLWGQVAEPEASVRLGWLDLPETGRDLLGELADLRAELAADGIDRIVLAGMGGSSLAPEVITRTAGVDLIVLDTTDPGQVRAAVTGDLSRTLVVVSSKSGGTIETDSHRRAFTEAFAAGGLAPEDVGRRFVAVTDPGSPLERLANESGFRRVFLADSTVGGRYSALSAFGLVPSALAGVNVTSLLDDARSLAPALGRDTANPGLDLGAALGAAYRRGRDKIVLIEQGSGLGATATHRLRGFGDWAEQLLAESTGKDGTGLLPVVVASPDAPGTHGDDVFGVLVGERESTVSDGLGAQVTGPLGAQFLVWEYATALAGRVIGINPFDQPNVAESKENTARILAEGAPDVAPAYTDGAVAVYGDDALLGSARDLRSALRALVDAVPDRGYLAVMAYLDRWADASAADLRDPLAATTEHPVTFGWGPRFLHSTGQYHKGGPERGAFLQITGAVTKDLPVPGRPFTFGRLHSAQAAGDIAALRQRGRPVLRLHLLDRTAGIGQILEALA